MTDDQAAALPPTLAANPRLSGWLQVQPRRLRAAEPRQGRDRPGHRHRAGADRRRRARRRPRPHSHGGDRHPDQPQRGHDLGQPVGRAVRHVRALRGGAGARRSTCRPPPSVLAWRPRASASRTAPSSARATCAPATGSSPTIPCWPATPRPALPPRRLVRAASPARRRRGSTCRTRCSGGRGSSTSSRCRTCCTGACCGRRPWAPSCTSLDEKPARAVPGVVAVVRDGSFIGVVAETEAAAEAGLAALRKGAVWDAGAGLPDETKLSAWLKSQPVETTTVDERKASTPPQVAKTIRRQYSRPFIAHASMAPSCAIAQWTAPTRCTSGRTARASTICAPT